MKSLPVPKTRTVNSSSPWRTKKLTVYLNANVKEIGKTAVTLIHEGKEIEMKNDAVIVCAGGTLPTPMLKEIGVMVDTYYGQAVPR